MISGPIAKDAQLKVINALANSNIEFVFVGSRAHGYAILGSDYDFVAENDPKTIAFLRGIPMVRISKSPKFNRPLDINTVEIFSRGKRNTNKVDVVLVKDLKKRIKLETVIHKLYQSGKIKEMTVNNWNTEYSKL